MYRTYYIILYKYTLLLISEPDTVNSNKSDKLSVNGNTWDWEYVQYNLITKPWITVQPTHQGPIS